MVVYEYRNGRSPGLCAPQPARFDPLGIRKRSSRNGMKSRWREAGSKELKLEVCDLKEAREVREEHSIS